VAVNKTPDLFKIIVQLPFPHPKRQLLFSVFLPFVFKNTKAKSFRSNLRIFAGILIYFQ